MIDRAALRAAIEQLRYTVRPELHPEASAQDGFNAGLDAALALLGEDPHDDRDRKIATLQQWKAEALVSLKAWHALGDALLPFADLTLGDDIPTTLATAIPALIRRLLAKV